MTEEQRKLVVVEARSWIGTPYLGREKKKKRGCDCGSLLQGVYEAVGLLEVLNFGDYDYGAPWAVRDGDALYLEQMNKYAVEIAEASVRPGDIVMYRIGRGWSHTAIVINWPGEVVHASQDQGVIAVPGNGGMLAGRQRRFWTLR